MYIFSGLPLYINLLIFLGAVVFIPGYIYKFLLQKENIDLSLIKSSFEVVIGKITCAIIGAFFGIILVSICVLLFTEQGTKLEASDYDMWNYVHLVLTFIIYIYFYFKFMISTTNSFLFNEEKSTELVKKFMFISEIISFAFLYIYGYTVARFLFLLLT